jgi:thiol-disulfide isomerase/thioredoxin
VYKPFVKGKPVLPIAVSESAPSFQLKDRDGKTHTSDDYKNSIVLINFWDSWCGYSNLGLADMKSLYQKHGGKVKFMGINFQDPIADPAKYLQDRGIGYTTLLHGDAVAKQFKVEAAPAFYIIDKQGKVAYGKLEYHPKVGAEIEAVLQRLLQQKE